MAASSITRPYRGIAADERIATRREALMRAGLQVFDTEGWDALSARRVCEVAGLTRRYFYESFASLDELVAAIYVRITGDVGAAVRALVPDRTLSLAARVDQAVAAGLATVEPPVKGRFLVAAQQRGGPIAPHQAAIRGELTRLVGRSLSATQNDPAKGSIEPTDTDIAARMILGASLALIDSWFTGEIQLSRAEVSARVATGAVAIIEALGRPNAPAI
jgi:AcrR family transcriptional regulator